MANQIHRLVYYSRNRLENPDDMSVDLEDILQRSRTNNIEAGITGALMFNNGCFAQILEGELAALEQTFERIQQDARHSDVSLLALEPIDRRSFPNWAMGFVGQSSKSAAAFAGIGRATGFDPSHMTGDQIHSILWNLALQEDVG